MRSQRVYKGKEISYNEYVMWGTYFNIKFDSKYPMLGGRRTSQYPSFPGHWVFAIKEKLWK